MATETDTPEADKLPDTKTEADKTVKVETDTKVPDVKAADEEKAKAAEARRREREIAKAREEAVEEFKKAAKKEADEAADLAKKTDADRHAAELKKLQDQVAAAKSEAAEKTLIADLAMELGDQDLAPANPKARDHIATAFKAQVAAGKTPEEALKAVHAEEPYLFKVPAAAQPEGTKVADKTTTRTQAKPAGTTAEPVTKVADDGEDASKIDSPIKLAEYAQTKHGISYRR